MSKSSQPPLSESQLEIMSLLWERGEATVAEVWREIKGRRAVARNTVQTMLVRLEEKGFLRHRERGNAFVYFPVKKRETTVRRMLRALTDSAFGGSTAGLVLSLLDSESITEEDAQRIEEMLSRKRPKRGKSK